jgi:hypothetical protein
MSDLEVTEPMTIHFDSGRQEDAFRQAVIRRAWWLVYALAEGAPANPAYMAPADCVAGSWN